MEETTLSQKVVNVPLLPPEEGRAENILFCFSFDLKFSKKEQFPHSSNQTGCEHTASSVLNHPLFSPQARSLHFKDMLLPRASPASPSYEPQS